MRSARHGLKDALARLGPGARRRRSRWGRPLLRGLARFDLALYQQVAATPMPLLDRPLRRLSHGADHWALWIGFAAGWALLGGARGRRAAAAGLLSMGASSALANVAMKAIGGRRRPDRAAAGVRAARWVLMPSSSSFPSGHSASAFGFATGAGRELPELALPLQGLAAAVAYSRVHTGVHYPADVVSGSLIGSLAGRVVPLALERWRSRRGSSA